MEEQRCQSSIELTSEVPEDLNLVFQNVYECSNGTVASINYEGKGKVYVDFEAWKSYLHEIIKTSQAQPIHISKQLIPEREKFLESIELFIDKLSSILDIDRSELNLSKHSLKLLSESVNSKRESLKDNKYLFPGLIAYFGEVLKSEADGNWVISQEKDGEFEVLVEDKSGNRYSFLTFMFDELFESETSDFLDLLNMLIEGF